MLPTDDGAKMKKFQNKEFVKMDFNQKLEAPQYKTVISQQK